MMFVIMRLLYELCDWTSLWQDATGKWYAYYKPEVLGYYGLEAERYPLPPLRYALLEKARKLIRRRMRQRR
jgi:hypothetical protein